MASYYVVTRQGEPCVMELSLAANAPDLGDVTIDMVDDHAPDDGPLLLDAARVAFGEPSTFIDAILTSDNAPYRTVARDGGTRFQEWHDGHWETWASDDPKVVARRLVQTPAGFDAICGRVTVVPITYQDGRLVGTTAPADATGAAWSVGTDAAVRRSVDEAMELWSSWVAGDLWDATLHGMRTGDTLAAHPIPGRDGAVDRATTALGVDDAHAEPLSAGSLDEAFDEATGIVARRLHARAVSRGGALDVMTYTTSVPIEVTVLVPHGAGPQALERAGASDQIMLCVRHQRSFTQLSDGCWQQHAPADVVPSEVGVNDVRSVLRTIPYAFVVDVDGNVVLGPAEGNARPTSGRDDLPALPGTRPPERLG